MKEKIYTVAIPFFSLLCSCDAKERIELPKHEEGEAPGKCLTRSSLFPDDLIAQVPQDHQTLLKTFDYIHIMNTCQF